MMAKGCNVDLSHNEPGFTLPSNIGELGDDIVNLNLSVCSLQGITCRVAPTQRDGTESEISHTFPFPRCAGRIPESIGNLTKLQTLKLEGNALTGA